MQKIFHKKPKVDHYIKVSARGRGRTKEQCEKRSICRLLATLSENNLIIEYPLKLYHRDRPDFNLKFETKSIGIEVTEAIQQDYAEAVAITEKEDLETIIDLSLFKWGAKKKNSKELREVISQEKIGETWEGDRVESEWAQAIWDAVKKKTAKLNAFQRFDEDWLLIYDNLPLPTPNLRKSLEYFRKISVSYWNYNEFKMIFIESDYNIVGMSKTELYQFKVI